MNKDKVQFITEKHHLDFIKQHSHLKTKDLCVVFNNEFNTNLTNQQMSNIRYKDYKLFKFPIYNEKYINFIKENASNYMGKDLVEVFNKHFNTNYDKQAIIRACKMLNVKLKPRGYDIGDIVPKSYRNGKPFKYLIKVSHTGNYHKDWQELSRYYYALYHGSIPKDHAIIFLDGNRLNIEKENLYAIHKSLLGSLRTFAINNGIEPMDNGIYTKAFCELLTTELILKGKYVYE